MQQNKHLQGVGHPSFHDAGQTFSRLLLCRTPLGLNELPVALDAHEHSGADKEGEERSAAIGKERQRHPDHGQDPGHIPMFTNA